jgi:predicted YcjX-like family ATPase
VVADVVVVAAVVATVVAAVTADHVEYSSVALMVMIMQHFRHPAWAMTARPPGVVVAVVVPAFFG